MIPIIVRGDDWTIPPTSGPEPNGPCMEASQFTTDRIYISCGEPATVRVFDDRAGRTYDMCRFHAEHNVRRGMRAVAGEQP